MIMTDKTISTNGVPKDEKPEFSIENVPDNVIEKAIEWATVYTECGNCGERQFMHFRPGYGSTEECKECGVDNHI